MATNLVKAELVELKPDFSDVKSDGKRVAVQFNPDSLKVSFANQIATEGTGSQKGTPGQLHVGAGTTKMALQLWFDATRVVEGATPVADVRDLTKQVTFFITPKKENPNDDKKFIPPAVRFLWGTFHFDGIMDAVEETLDYWSPDGKPLRATISLSMSQQKIEAFELAARNNGRAQEIASLVGKGGGATAGRPSGTTPMIQARVGGTVQGLADNAGNPDWQSVAAANGIENPRMLQPGQLLNLNPTLRFGTPDFMPVVINEFEAVAEGAPANTNQNQERQTANPPKEKPDADALLRLWHERKERVRAH